MKLFFEVTAKCGHVGRHRFYKGLFYEIAESAKDAAAIVRMRGRVKHDHKDAILSVKKISEERFVEGRQQHASEPYFNCYSKHEQRLAWSDISKNVYAEPVKHERPQKHSQKKIYSGKSLIKKPSKGFKYNLITCDQEYELAII